MMLFHSWTTLNGIAQNLQTMAAYSDTFPRFYALNLTLYSEFLPIFRNVAAAGLAVQANHSYGWDYTIRDNLAKKAFELYKILFSCFGPDMSIPAFLKDLSLLKDHSVDEILATHFGVVPVAG